MSTTIEKSFSINLKILTMFGLYFPKRITLFYRARSYFLYFVLIYPITALAILYFIFEKEIEPVRIGYDASFLAQFACQITKLLPFVINGDRVKKCIHYLESPLFATMKTQHIDILKKCIATCQRNSKVFLIGVIGGLIGWMLRPFSESELSMPSDIWLPDSIRNSKKAYISTYSFITIGTGYVAVASAAIDPLIGGLACLAAGQLQILKEKLQNLNDDSEFVKEYQRCFSLPVFSQLVSTVIIICFVCFQIRKMTPMTFNFIMSVGTLNVLMIEIYFYCYYGTILYEESTTLTQAVYMGMWYEYDTESRKYLILLMERSKRPVVITVGKVLDLSVLTFTNILKKSYSLLAVLTNQ